MDNLTGNRSQRSVRFVREPQLHPVEVLFHLLAIGALLWFFIFTALITAKYLDLIPSTTTTGVRK